MGRIKNKRKKRDQTRSYHKAKSGIFEMKSSGGRQIVRRVKHKR
jgi:hypothetical protein